MNNVKSWLNDNPIAREFVYLIITAVAIQLTTSLGDLLSATETTKSVGDLWASVTVWGAAFVQALVLTVFRQAVGWFVLKLAGIKP